MKSKLNLKIAAALLVSSVSFVFADEVKTVEFNVESNSLSRLGLLRLVANDIAKKTGSGVLQAQIPQENAHGIIELREGSIELNNKFGLGDGALKMYHTTSLNVKAALDGENALPLAVSFSGMVSLNLEGKLDLNVGMASFDSSQDAVITVSGAQIFSPKGRYVAEAKVADNRPTDRMILDLEAILYLSDNNLVPPTVVMKDKTKIQVKSNLNNYVPAVVQLPDIIVGLTD